MSAHDTLSTHFKSIMQMVRTHLQKQTDEAQAQFSRRPSGAQSIGATERHLEDKAALDAIMGGLAVLHMMCHSMVSIDQSLNNIAHNLQVLAETAVAQKDAS